MDMLLFWSGPVWVKVLFSPLAVCWTSDSVGKFEASEVREMWFCADIRPNTELGRGRYPDIFSVVLSGDPCGPKECLPEDSVKCSLS